MEDRSATKMWLVRHLEVTRQIMLEDLRVATVSFYTRFILVDYTVSVNLTEALYRAPTIIGFLVK